MAILTHQKRLAIRRVIIAIVLAASAFTVAMLSSRNNLLPNGDEIFHLLAARSVIENQDLSINSGSYTRGQLYTRYVALGYQVFGPSLTAAKIVTGVTFALLIGGIFISLDRSIGTGTSVLAAVLLLFAPHSLEIATTVRFYMPQALLFWIGAWSVYRAVTGSAGRFVLGTVAAVAFIGAYQLQEATLIGIAAIAIWATIYAAYSRFEHGINSRQLLLVSSILVVAFFIVFLSGALEPLWTKYRGWALWNEGSRNRYYYWMMTDDYNPFWAALPLLSILAFNRAPRVAGFAISVFTICFVLHTFGGMKEDRYIYYILPFFFLVVSIGLAAAFSFLSSSTAALSPHSYVFKAMQSKRFGILVSFGVLSFFVVSNLGYISSAKDLLAGTAKREQPRWDLLLSEYGEELRNSPVLLTTNPNFAIYFLDRVPVSIGLSRLIDGSKDGTQFSQDKRTGAILISEPEALERVVGCFNEGVLIAEVRQWLNNPNTGVTESLLPIIDNRMDRVSIPEDWQLRVYRWSRSPGQSVANYHDECTALTQLIQ